MSSDFDIKTLSIPKLLEHPYVQELHEVINILYAENEALKVAFRKSKKLPAKPDVKPSKLDEVPPTNSDATTDTTTANDKSTDKPKDTPKRAGSQKRSKTKNLVIHQQKECQVIAPDSTWTFLGYKDYIVQGLKIELHNTCYKREEWETPDGKYIIAPLPAGLFHSINIFNFFMSFEIRRIACIILFIPLFRNKFITIFLINEKFSAELSATIFE